MAVLFLALLYRQYELAVLTLILILMGLLARIWAQAGLKRFGVEFASNHWHAFPGEKIPVSLKATNSFLLPVKVSVQLPVVKYPHSFEHTIVYPANHMLPGKGMNEIHWEITASERGCYSVGPLHIALADPFIFCSRTYSWREKKELLVFPQIKPITPPKPVLKEYFGTLAVSSPVFDPVYTAGLRDYHHGNPARYINWKASTRRQRLQEKTFDSTVQLKVLIAVDVSQYAELNMEADFEQMLEAAASLSNWLISQNARVGIITNGILYGSETNYIAPAGGTAQLTRILALLARLGLESTADLCQLLKQTKLGSSAFCLLFTHRPDQKLQQTLAKLNNMRLPTLTVISDTSISPEVNKKIISLKELLHQKEESYG
ncbi:MAG: DUF58 domain-containing protein [Bacillota bacterium]|nr:DUF58 domain-containing protein [Bacillota bacterium]